MNIQYSKSTYISIFIVSLVVWFLIYKALSSELFVDVIGYYIFSIILSLISAGLLLMLWLKNRFAYKKNKPLNFFLIITATPVIHTLIWIYFNVFVMLQQWEQSSGGEYSVLKFQNFFQSKYYYYNERDKSDTIIVTVCRNNKVQNIVYLKNGIETKTSLDSIPYKAEFKKIGLLEY